MHTTIIGGADGPTDIYLTGVWGNIQWINLLGLLIITLLMIPNIIYAIRNKDSKDLCTNKVVNILEQVGRYGTMFLMVFNIGILEFGFSSVNVMLLYTFGNILLIVIYWVFWGIYFKRQSLMPALMLAIIPTVIFLLSGITLRHYLLVLFAILFGICHVYVTYVNNEGNK